MTDGSEPIGGFNTGITPNPGTPNIQSGSPPAPVPAAPISVSQTVVGESGKQFSQIAEEFRISARDIVKGQEFSLDLMFITLLSRGHALLEGVPGTGKTLMARTLAGLMKLQFKRVQFMPDLMPSDLVGTKVYDLQKSEFHTRLGPLFADIVLADEINRAPAKTQSALLEAMQERQITIEGELHRLSPAFTVFGTQNPVEHEGTYRLPEAELDRFLFRISVSHLPKEQELQVLQAYHTGRNLVEEASSLEKHILNAGTLESARNLVSKITVQPEMVAYIQTLIDSTRDHDEVSVGCSLRAGVGLLLASKARALLEGRDFVTPDDVKLLAPPVMAHRLVLRAEAELEGRKAEDIVAELLHSVPVPR